MSIIKWKIQAEIPSKVNEAKRQSGEEEIDELFNKKFRTVFKKHVILVQ